MVVAVLFDDLGHSGGGVGVGTADGDERIDCVAGDGGNQREKVWICRGGGMLSGRWKEVFSADRGDVGDYLDVVGESQILLSYGASCYSA